MASSLPPLDRPGEDLEAPGSSGGVMGRALRFEAAAGALPSHRPADELPESATDATRCTREAALAAVPKRCAG